METSRRDAVTPGRESPVRFPFMQHQVRRRLRSLHAQVPGLLKEIADLEHALELSAVDGDTPSAYGPAQQLRGSILRLELARKRCDLDAVRARVREIDASGASRRSPEAMASDAPGVEPAAVSPPQRSHVLSRIMLSSLAAVVVLLGLAKLPVDQVAEVQAHIVSALPAVSSIRHVDELSSSALAAERAADAPSAATMSRLPEPVGLVAAEPAVPRAASESHEATGTTTARAMPPEVAPTEEAALEPGATDADGLVSPEELATVVEVEVGRGSVVTLADVRLREGPGTTARILRTTRTGSRLAVLGTASGWTQVQAPDGLTGWIISSALRPI